MPKPIKKPSKSRPKADQINKQFGGKRCHSSPPINQSPDKKNAQIIKLSGTSSRVYTNLSGDKIFRRQNLPETIQRHNLSRTEVKFHRERKIHWETVGRNPNDKSNLTENQTFPGNQPCHGNDKSSRMKQSSQPEHSFQHQCRETKF